MFNRHPDESPFTEPRAGIQYASPIPGQSWADLQGYAVDANPDRHEHLAPLKPATYIDRGEGWLRSANQVVVCEYTDAATGELLPLCQDCVDHSFDHGAHLVDPRDTAPDTACDHCSHRNGRWAGYGALLARSVAEGYRCGVEIVPDDALAPFED